MPRDGAFDQFLRLSEEVFAQGDYETACHSLMAALDRASYLKDSQALTSVNQLADQQLDALQQTDLPTRLSSEGAVRLRSLNSLYHSIMQQATTWGQLVDLWHQRSARPQHHRSSSPIEEGTR